METTKPIKPPKQIVRKKKLHKKLWIGVLRVLVGVVVALYFSKLAGYPFDSLSEFLRHCMYFGIVVEYYVKVR